jgi:hypothetical protein
VSEVNTWMVLDVCDVSDMGEDFEVRDEDQGPVRYLFVSNAY